MDFDQLREDAKNRYKDFEVTHQGETLTMLSPLRLNKSDRVALTKLFDENEEGSSDQEAIMEQVIKIVSASTSVSRALLALTKDDLPTRALLIERYQEAVSLGEPSDSPS